MNIYYKNHSAKLAVAPPWGHKIELIDKIRLYIYMSAFAYYYSFLVVKEAWMFWFYRY